MKMTVDELIVKLQEISAAGHGSDIVCVPELDETACAGDMVALRSILATKFQALASPDAENGDPAVLLI